MSASDTSNLHYAAALFRKMTDQNTGDEPTPDELRKLSDTMLKLALAVMSEGRDRTSRRKRLLSECSVRGFETFITDVDAADPRQDLLAIQTPEGWQSFDLVDVVTESLPALSWLVKPYVPRPSVTAWFGKPKSMKSLLVLDMCLHVAGGLVWLCDPDNPSDGIPVTKARVVWLDLENGSATLKRRMRAIALALGMGKERGQVQAYSMPTPWPDLSQAEEATALINRIKALGDIGILVIDHLGQALGAIDENSPLIARVMGNIRQIAETCNVAIVLIHHAKKGQGRESGAPEDQLRGHGAILANVDAAYLVERDRSERTHLKLTPVAVRGPDAPNVAANFSFDQDENLELIKARFWRLGWRTNYARAKDAILSVLLNGTKNYTELKSAVKAIEADLSDEKIRSAIATLEGTAEIVYTKGDKGAKLYSIAKGGADDE
jgi:hypothetical protein